MVHKKSEYRLQFHLLEKDIRKQIWQENIQFRETCRSLNQADHYWSYQLTDERCECELEEVDEDEAALPPHKLKHKILLAQYGSAKSETQDVQKVQEFPSPSIKQRGTPAQVQLEESKDARDIAVQTPDWEAQERRLEDYVQNEDKNLTQNNNSALQKSGKEQKKETQTLIKSYLPVTQSITIQDPNSQSRASNKAERCDTATSHGQHSGVSQTSGLTRTSRKAYFEEKKSPFVSFGWNDSDRNVGDKKTYNVHAPEHECIHLLF